MENEIVPSDLQCDVFVFYISDNGSPHFVQKCGIRIPLFIVAKPHHKLEKDGNVKITFSVNKPVVNLLSLYNGMQTIIKFSILLFFVNYYTCIPICSYL